VIDSDQNGPGRPSLPSAFYYARSPGVSTTGGRPPEQPLWNTGQQLGRRSSGIWKPILLVGGCLVGAAWIVQAPGKPVVGLIGLLPIVIVALAVNPFGLRNRLPLLGSTQPIRAISGWAIIGALLLATEFLGFSGLIQTTPTAHQATAAAPPAASSAAAPPAQAAAPSATAPAASAPAPAPAPVSSSAPAPPAAAPAPVSAAARQPAPAPAAVNPVVTLVASVLAVLDPTLAAELGLSGRAQTHAACPRSAGHRGHHMSLTSGAASGAAAMLQMRQCNHGGSH